MKKLTIMAGMFLITGVVCAQTATTPSQSQNTQSVQKQMPAGQTGQVTTGQTNRTLPQQAQSTPTGQVPKVNTRQNPQQINQSQTAPVVPTEQSTIVESTIPQNQDNQQIQTVITTGQDPATGVQQIDIAPAQTVQPANTGQVPKTYSNTQSQLPFQQYQPKPTGKVNPSQMPASSRGRVR